MSGGRGGNWKHPLPYVTCAHSELQHVLSHVMGIVISMCSASSGGLVQAVRMLVSQAPIYLENCEADGLANAPEKNGVGKVRQTESTHVAEKLGTYCNRHATSCNGRVSRSREAGGIQCHVSGRRPHIA